MSPLGPVCTYFFSFSYAFVFNKTPCPMGSARLGVILFLFPGKAFGLGS